MRRLSVLTIVGVVLALSGGAIGQQQPVFRTVTGGVSVDVSVRDGNQPVLGLAASDFVLYDNDKRQTIDSISIGAVPVDATFFVGTNNQTAGRELEALGSDVRAIAAVLRPTDRVRLLTLENQVTDVFGWRAGADAQAAMDVRVGGVQSLYDAIFLAMMHRPDPDRRHLIVAVSDGVEFGSVLDSTTVRDVARRAEAVLHLVFVDQTLPSVNPPATTGVLSATNPLPQTTSQGTGFLFLRASWFHVMADQHGLDRLQEAARLTGGSVRHGSSGEPVVDSFKRAFDDFRQSYLLRYTAAGVAPSGWHEIRVEMANGKKYAIRARKGYFGG